MRPLPLNEHLNLMWQLKKTYKLKKIANMVTEKDLVYYQKKKNSIISVMVFDRPADHFISRGLHTSEIKVGTNKGVV